MDIAGLFELRPNTTSGGIATQIAPASCHLEIPPGPAGRYRLAQLDDYGRLARRAFRWHAPLAFSLRARASSQDIPGTWGFGLWNDPFGLGFVQGGGLRLPTLPNAAWFFFASQHNYLSLRDDLPAQGGLAVTFQAPRWPAAALLLGLPFLPLLFLPPAARQLRRWGRRFVHQDAAALSSDIRGWHAYALDWHLDRVIFRVDDVAVLETGIVPHAPLGLVMWVDNQYAALPPDGRLRSGTLPTPEPAWVEIEDFRITQIT